MKESGLIQRSMKPAESVGWVEERIQVVLWIGRSYVSLSLPCHILFWLEAKFGSSWRSSWRCYSWFRGGVQPCYILGIYLFYSIIFFGNHGYQPFLLRLRNPSAFLFFIPTIELLAISQSNLVSIWFWRVRIALGTCRVQFHCWIIILYQPKKIYFKYSYPTTYRYLIEFVNLILNCFCVFALKSRVLLIENLILFYWTFIITQWSMELPSVSYALLT